uniref:Uncharacterized protein n=1 Tax=Anguilla anguilla TaxID=7936 RepID=A0A0E9X2X6_ANGAN
MFYHKTEYQQIPLKHGFSLHVVHKQLNLIHLLSPYYWCQAQKNKINNNKNKIKTSMRTKERDRDHFVSLILNS